ncbi:MAG: anti-sigma factor [Pyrinomonadaceae bacterium]
MVNNGNNTNCNLQDELISYIYGEIEAANRAAVESHLVDCASCTDEFTALSSARHSVFEWQRETFANLPTPKIVVPLKNRPVETPSGILSGIKEWFSMPSWLVPAAVLLAIIIGSGVVLLRNVDDSSQQVAANMAIQRPVELPQVVNKTEVAAEPSLTSSLPERNWDAPPQRTVNGKHAQPVTQPVLAQPAKMAKQPPRGPDQIRQARKVPVLGNHEDVDDRSLRLTDLFDDGGDD